MARAIAHRECAPSLLAAAEHARLRRYFVQVLCTRREFIAYWQPLERWITLRSVNARKAHAVPSDAIRIGHYAHPFDADQFMGDVEAVLARLEHMKRKSA